MMASEAPSEQVFSVSASIGYPEECRLLELPPEIVAQLESADAQQCILRVRGRSGDIATLVDLEDNAYRLHTAHTSNSLHLLAHTGGDALELRMRAHQTLELQRVQPAIRARLLEVLGWDERGAFRGTEFDPPVQGVVKGAVTDSVLERHVAAGSRTLVQALEDVGAFRDGRMGHWRLLDAGYCADLLRLVLATLTEHGWSMREIRAEWVHKALAPDVGGELLPEAVTAVLARFGRLVESTDAEPLWAIEPVRVERFLAEQLFMVGGDRAWPVSEFIQALQAAMPPQLPQPKPEDWASRCIPSSPARDLAYASTGVDAHRLLTVAGVPWQSTLLYPLSRSEMPADPRTRLQRMFAAKSRWRRSELVPFLEDLVDVDARLLAAHDKASEAAVSKAVDTWLLKYGRSVPSSAGEPVYASRVN
ncbi:Ctf8p and Ctf18p associating protein [Coemansia sp. Benny D115]|nr:Ctf8p and Ctf18p associating protein [Coemansia sp. Benny D115]